MVTLDPIVEAGSPPPSRTAPASPSLPAVRGGVRASGGWIAWRGAEVWVCWPDPQSEAACTDWRRAWPAPSAGLAGAATCRPDAAAFIDHDRAVMRCALDDDQHWLARRGDATLRRVTPGDVDARPRRPVRTACDADSLRVAWNGLQSRPDIEPCAARPTRRHVAPVGNRRCAGFPAQDVVAKLRRPTAAGIEVELFAELTVDGKARRYHGVDARWRARAAGSSVLVGLQVGFDAVGRSAWRREYLRLRRRSARALIRCDAQVEEGHP